MRENGGMRLGSSRHLGIITMLRRVAASRAGLALRVAGQRRSSQLAQAPAPEMAALAGSLAVACRRRVRTWRPRAIVWLHYTTRRHSYRER